MIWLVLISLVLVYIFVNVGKVIFRNLIAHQFFKVNSPKLPVVPNPNLFFGHAIKISYQDQSWKVIDELHEKYGPTFGHFMCEQPWVSTKDLDLIKLIEIDQAHKHVNRSKFGAPIKEFNESIFQLADHDWKRVRRAIAPALTNHKIRSDEVSSDIQSIVAKLKDSIELKMDKGERMTGTRSFIMNIDDTFKRYAIAAIFLLTYKRDNEVDFNSKEERWVHDMEDLLRNVKNPFNILTLAFPFIYPLTVRLIHFHALGKFVKKIVDYIVEATNVYKIARALHEQNQKRLSKETGAKESPFSHLKSEGPFKRGFVDTIIDALVEKRINYDHFVGTLLALLMAGSGTTADTTTCLVWHLAHKPDIQEKLRKTIREDGVDADYVMWCIKEAIRWHPAVPLGTGRIVTEDVTVNGLLIAKGTFVMPSTYSIHHDSNIWPEADEFKPERWANSNEFHPAAFMGFGLGARNCIGAKLAIHEIKLVMQMLLANYRIERCPETTDKYNFSSPGLFFTLLDEELKVRLVSCA